MITQSPLLWLHFPLCDWPDSYSLTTPPHWDRLPAVPFPVWPRAWHSGMWSSLELLHLVLGHHCGTTSPKLSTLATPTPRSLLQRKHSELNYTLQCVASRMPGIKSTDQPSSWAKRRVK
ncbi:hypothetical protein AOLI_G00145140 [Acnodon oligacanthus]